MSYTKVKFINKDKSVFFSVLKENIDDYFTKNSISKTGGKKIIGKALFMLGLYIIPYSLILSGRFSSWEMLLLAVVMGVGVAGVGMSVMHDAIHSSFSNRKWVNRIFSGSMYMLGGNVYNWQVQHNQLHHTYTNIHEVDEDITGKFLLRLSYSEKLKKIHRYQHIYAFFLYTMMTLSFFVKDFKEIRHYNKMAEATGIVSRYPVKELIKLIITKLIYFVFILGIPLYFLPITFGQWLIGFLVLHWTAGLILSTIFQLAHVVEGASNPVPDQDGNIENSWAIHQLQTTSNFSGKNKWLSWFIGGLDFQIEHHLFPNISHVHYSNISEIVKETAEEFNIPYNAKYSLTNAINSHVQMLKNLGNYQAAS